MGCTFEQNIRSLEARCVAKAEDYLQQLRFEFRKELHELCDERISTLGVAMDPKILESEVCYDHRVWR